MKLFILHICICALLFLSLKQKTVTVCESHTHTRFIIINHANAHKFSKIIKN